LNNVQYAISVVVPVADSQPWEPPDPVAALLLIFRILSWVFVAILLAGVTGLLKQQWNLDTVEADAGRGLVLGPVAMVETSDLKSQQHVEGPHLPPIVR
jgi:hypothetical protein